MGRRNLWVIELSLVKIRALKISDYEDIIKLWMRSDLPFRKKGRDSKTMMRRHMIAYPELFILQQEIISEVNDVIDLMGISGNKMDEDAWRNSPFWQNRMSGGWKILCSQ